MRYKNKSITIISIAVLLFFVISTGGFAKAPTNKITSQSNSTMVDNSTYIDANQILMFVTNHGNFGRDLSGVFGYDYGTWYPYTGDIDDYHNHTIFGNYSPLYAAGLWVGGKVNNEVRTSVSEYWSEFTPGPMLNNTFITDAPEFKVYKLYAESLFANPNQDFTNWPVSQGAPLDANNHPKMQGDQMLWSVFNDADLSKHTNMGSTPLGVEIQMTTIADNSYPNSLFLVYKIYNKSTNTIDSCYIGHWSDPDLGYAGNDLAGCDTLSNIWYCYNSTNPDPNYGTTSPSLGFKLLYGPIVPSNGDSAYFDGNYITNHRNLPMTAFNHYAGATDPDSPQTSFNYMKGLSRTGLTIMYNGSVTKYPASGDPVTGSGNLDVVASDHRMMASSGPFTFAPGDSQFVMIRMSVESLASNFASITKVKNTLNEPFNIPTEIDEQSFALVPNQYLLSQNYPNPFNPTTEISFSLPTRSDVTLEIFNLIGQKIETLIEENLSAGIHSINWDASEVATGIYFYKITADDFVQTKKMMLLK